MITLQELGYNEFFENKRRDLALNDFDIARVTSEHKERYIVRNESAEYEAEIIGNLRYTAEKRSDFPAVGDWVACSEYDEQKMLIHALIPRRNILERRAAGKKGEAQIIAANVDFGLIVQAVCEDFSINRIERYMTVCINANVTPVLILNKTDLIEESDLKQKVNQIEKRLSDLRIIPFSNETKRGFDELTDMLERSKTYALLGSSGVGKSSLVNNISGQFLMKTNSISNSTKKGRHVTSHRELIILETGGVLIDNPGMREVGITDQTEGLEETFTFIFELANSCKYKDCTHTAENGCAVIQALNSGKLGQETYEQYLKMERERTHFESSAIDIKRKEKELGKVLKYYQNIKKKNNL
jgi:ribosome biogenesis GTPase